MSLSSFSLFLVLSTLSATTVLDEFKFASRIKPDWLKYIENNELSSEDQLKFTVEKLRKKYGIVFPGNTIAEVLTNVVEFPNILNFNSPHSLNFYLKDIEKYVLSVHIDQRVSKIKNTLIPFSSLFAYKALTEGLTVTKALGLIADFENALKRTVERYEENQFHREYNDIKELSNFFKDFCENFTKAYNRIGKFLSVRSKLNVMLQAQIRYMVLHVYVDNRKFDFDSFFQKINMIIPAFCLANQNSNEKVFVVTEEDRKFTSHSVTPFNVVMSQLFEEPICGQQNIVL